MRIDAVALLILLPSILVSNLFELTVCAEPGKVSSSIPISLSLIVLPVIVRVANDVWFAWPIIIAFSKSWAASPAVSIVLLVIVTVFCSTASAPELMANDPAASVSTLNSLLWIIIFLFELLLNCLM